MQFWQKWSLNTQALWSEWWIHVSIKRSEAAKRYIHWTNNDTKANIYYVAKSVAVDTIGLRHSAKVPYLTTGTLIAHYYPATNPAKLICPMRNKWARKWPASRILWMKALPLWWHRRMHFSNLNCKLPVMDIYIVISDLSC